MLAVSEEDGDLLLAVPLALVNDLHRVLNLIKNQRSVVNTDTQYGWPDIGPVNPDFVDVWCTAGYGI